MEQHDQDDKIDEAEKEVDKQSYDSVKKSLLLKSKVSQEFDKPTA